MLHGLGFAGALVALGLPQTAIPLALLLFNLGVEAGQILFVVTVLVVLASFRKLDLRLPQWAKPLPVYAMGSVAAYWFWVRAVLLFEVFAFFQFQKYPDHDVYAGSETY